MLTVVRLTVRLPEWRIDEERSDGRTTTSLVKDGKYYTCRDGACLRLPGFDTDLPTRWRPGRELERLRSEHAQIGVGKQETISGRAAICYRFGPKPRAEPYPSDYYFALEACFDHRGVLIREKSKGGAAVRLESARELIDFSDTLPEMDFSLPFPVTSTIELPGTGT